MSNPIVMQSLERTEIAWSDEPDSEGLLITQIDYVGADSGSIWIPSDHVAAFISAVQKAAAKR